MARNPWARNENAPEGTPEALTVGTVYAHKVLARFNLHKGCH
jgi:hypothetical protein